MTKVLESIPGSPTAEHARSPAAKRVASLARQADLFFTHFEHRRRIVLPPEWEAHPGDGVIGGWVGGSLPEPKYQAFRHDLLVASFHPGHRAKWTAHELCHALVGFAFRPGAPVLFHALGAWLAELLPVALWYFFDEAGLQKCERHRGQGPLFQEHCTECERVALRGPDLESSRRAAKFMREGEAFVKRELLAIGQSQKNGLPRGTRYATLDLASDGLAYAQAHGARLRAPEMERFVALFFGRDQGHHATLDALEARVVEVCRGLTQGSKVRPWRATRWDYVAQDVGYRLLTLRAQCEGLQGQELDKLINGLAKQRTQAGLTRAIDGYRELALERGRKRFKLPATEEFFAVGYDLPQGLGHSVAQLDAGIASACPGTHRALGKESAAMSSAFARADQPERAPIGRRFAAFLASSLGGPLADLARVEAAITHVAPRDQVTQTLPFEEGIMERLRLAPGAEVVMLDHDVLGSSGAALKRARHLPASRFLGVVRSGPQDVDLLELPAELGRTLMELGSKAVPRLQLTIDDATCHELLASGLLVPDRYRIE